MLWSRWRFVNDPFCVLVSFIVLYCVFLDDSHTQCSPFVFRDGKKKAQREERMSWKFRMFNSCIGITISPYVFKHYAPAPGFIRGYLGVCPSRVDVSDYNFIALLKIISQCTIQKWKLVDCLKVCLFCYSFVEVFFGSHRL